MRTLRTGHDGERSILLVAGMKDGEIRLEEAFPFLDIFRHDQEIRGVVGQTTGIPANVPFPLFQSQRFPCGCKWVTVKNGINTLHNIRRDIEKVPFILYGD